MTEKDLMPLLRVEHRHPELLDYIGVSYGLSMTDLRLTKLILIWVKLCSDDLLEQDLGHLIFIYKIIYS